MKSLLLFNRVSIDSLRSNITKKRVKSLENLNSNFWSFLDDMQTKSKYLINQIERKRYKGTPKTNKATEIQVMQIGKDKHAHSFLITKATQQLNIQSNYSKLELSSNGLAQLHTTPKEIYKKLYHTFSPLKLSTIDLSIDISQPLPSKESLKPFCDEKYIYTCNNGVYLNRPSLPSIERIVIYDKAVKEKIKRLWSRVEFTCKVNQRLKDFTPPYNQIYNFMKNVFNQTFTVETYERQARLLTDGRSYNQRVIKSLLVIWLMWIPFLARM